MVHFGVIFSYDADNATWYHHVDITSPFRHSKAFTYMYTCPEADRWRS